MISGSEEQKPNTKTGEQTKHTEFRSGQNGSHSHSPSHNSPNAQQDAGRRVGAMEVSVDSNIDKAMKILKRKLIKEGLFKELKSRRYYEKPSERRKRKSKESIKKLRKEEARNRKNQGLFS